MDFNTIMQEITSKLTGEAKTDVTYLTEQIKKYKGHELGKEIGRACGRLIYELIPDEKRSEFDRILNNDQASWRSTLEEARFSHYKHNNATALKVLEPLVKKMEEWLNNGLFAEDAESVYYCFGSTFESAYYCIMNEPLKVVRSPGGLPIADIYVEYGSLLIDLNRVPDAQIALSKAYKWAPVSCSTAFEYAETFKMLGDIEHFYKLTLDIFKFAYTPEYLARCYRNAGFYFVERKLWQEAMSCFLASKDYDKKSINAQSELYYINAETHGKVKEPGPNEFIAYSEMYGFPLGPDRDVIGIALALGTQLKEQAKLDAARYFFNIAYNLTKDEGILKTINQLPVVSN